MLLPHAKTYHTDTFDGHAATCGTPAPGSSFTLKCLRQQPPTGNVKFAASPCGAKSFHPFMALVDRKLWFTLEAGKEEAFYKANYEAVVSDPPSKVKLRFARPW